MRFSMKPHFVIFKPQFHRVSAKNTSITRSDFWIVIVDRCDASMFEHVSTRTNSCTRRSSSCYGKIISNIANLQDKSRYVFLGSIIEMQCVDKQNMSLKLQCSGWKTTKAFKQFLFTSPCERHIRYLRKISKPKRIEGTVVHACSGNNRQLVFIRHVFTNLQPVNIAK